MWKAWTGGEATVNQGEGARWENSRTASAEEVWRIA